MTNRIARVIGSILIAVFASCSQAPDDPRTPIAGSCTDGVKQGDETGVDCGGSCESCPVGEGCSVDADCTFGSCAAGRCLAPTGGPAATGVVTAPLTREAKTIEIVTGEGVRVTLDLPAGAVRKPVTLTFTPQPTRPGQWLNLAVEPGGVLLAEEATLTIALPPGVVPREGQLGYSGGPERVLLPSTVDETARTLTSRIRLLGNPAVPVKNALTASEEYWRRYFLFASRLPLADAVPAVRMLIEELLQEGRFEDAIAAQMGIVNLIQRRSEEGWDDLVPPMLDHFAARSCEALPAEIARLATVPSRCAWELRENGQKLMFLGMIIQLTDSASPGRDGCSAMSAWLDAFEAEGKEAADTFRDERPAWRTCECANPDRRVPPECAEKSHQPELAGWEWDLVFASLDDHRDHAVELQAVSAPQPASFVRTAVVDPMIAIAREQAYHQCLGSSDTRPLAGVRNAGGPAEVARDAQRCATRVTVRSKTASGEAVSETSVAPPEQAGSAAPEPSRVDVARDGSIDLSGPIHALRCADGRIEADELIAKVVGPSTAEVHRATVQSELLLSETAAVVLQMSALRSAAGAAAGDPVTLELVRRSPACDGALGAGETLLASIVLEEPAFTLAPVTVRAHVGDGVHTCEPVVTTSKVPVRATNTNCNQNITASVVQTSDGVALEVDVAAPVYGGAITHSVEATFLRAGKLTLEAFPEAMQGAGEGSMCYAARAPNLPGFDPVAMVEPPEPQPQPETSTLDYRVVPGEVVKMSLVCAFYHGRPWVGRGAEFRFTPD